MQTQITSKLRHAAMLAFLVLSFAASSAFAQTATPPATNCNQESFTTPTGMLLTAPPCVPSEPDFNSAQHFSLSAASGEIDGKKFDPISLNFSDMVVGEHRNGTEQVTFEGGHRLTLHYWVKRLSADGRFWWLYAELPATPSFTIPGGPWLRGSQIVWVGYVTMGPCLSGPVFGTSIIRPIGAEIGWLDASVQSPNGPDTTFHRDQYYPTPGSQDVGGVTVFRWFETPDPQVTPNGEWVGTASAVHVFDPARRTELFLLKITQSKDCTPCRMPTRMVNREIQN